MTGPGRIPTVSLSLKTRLLLAISLLVLASSLLISLAVYLAVRADAVSKAENRLAYEAKKTLGRLDRTVAQQILNALMLARLRAFTSALQFGIFEEAHSLCVTWAEQTREVSSLLVLDNNRRIRASSGAYPVGITFDTFSLDRVLSGEPWIFEDVHWDSVQKQHVYSVAARLRSDSADLGFLVVDFSWTRLVNVMGLTVGPDASTRELHYLLLNRSGLVTATSHQELAPRLFRTSLAGAPLASVSAVLGGGEGAVLETDFLGDKVISGYVSSSGFGDWKGAGWKLVASEGESHALGVLQQIRNRVVLCTAAMTLLGCLLAWLLVARYIAAPIRDLISLFRRVAEGDLTCAVSGGGQDEMGELKRAALGMVQNLGHLTRSIVETSEQVAIAVAEIGVIAEEVSEGSHRQSAAAEETLGTMTRMAAAEENMAETAECLATNVEETCATVQELGGSIQAISASAAELAHDASRSASAIDQMTESVQALAGMSDVQSQSVDAVGAAIARIAESVDDVARRVQEAGEIARRNAEQGEAGGNAVRRTAEAVETMGAVIQATAEAIRKLEARSEEVRKIVRFIEDVSNQTNLLALNAAIIAAQAGEQGKGFGVVADNVRDLAQRTKVAAKDIGELIRRMNEETIEAASLASDTLNEAREGADLSRMAGQSISSILDGIDRSAGLFAEVAASCTHQERLASDVVTAMRRLSEITGQLRAAAAVQSDTGKSISQAAQSVRNITAEVDGATREQATASNQIVYTMSQMSEMTQRVAMTSAAQSENGARVVDALKGVRDMAARHLGATARLASAAELLTRQGKEMRSVIRKFRV